MSDHSETFVYDRTLRELSHEVPRALIKLLERDSLYKDGLQKGLEKVKSTKITGLCKEEVKKLLEKR